MEFQRGVSYEITYKSTKSSKVAMYLCSSDGVNIFFHISGEFGVSDAFIANGSAVIKEVADI